jgi:hypothetical protein
MNYLRMSYQPIVVVEQSRGSEYFFMISLLFAKKAVLKLTQVLFFPRSPFYVMKVT